MMCQLLLLGPLVLQWLSSRRDSKFGHKMTVSLFQVDFRFMKFYSKKECPYLKVWMWHLGLTLHHRGSFHLREAQGYRANALVVMEIRMRSSR